MRLWAKRVLFAVLGLVGLVPTTGCNSLFVHGESSAASGWDSYDKVDAAFKTIVPYHTTMADLQSMGFDPKVSPNVKILTYVDIIQTFMPNPGIRLKDLAPPVRDCIEARENSCAYEVDLHHIQDQRHGNLFLDIFGFNRRTHESGWRFKGLILIKDNLVVYKLASGEPKISSDSKQVKPLGPLQELDLNATEAANYAK